MTDFENMAVRAIVPDMAIPLGRLLLIIAVLMQGVGARQAQVGSVRGAVRTGVGPMEGIRVAVEPVDNTLGAGVLESIGLTEKDGTFLLENVTPGRYHVVFGRIGAPVYHPGVTNKNEATTILVVAGATTTVPDMISKTTSVSGTVIDLKTGQGRRIQSLVLCCEFDLLAPSAAPTTTTTAASSLFRFFTTPSRPLTAAVRDDGTFSFPAVVPGEYYLQAVDPAIVPTA